MNKQEFIKKVLAHGLMGMAIDIESVPNRGPFYQLGEQRITHNQIEEERRIMSVTWLWIHEPTKRYQLDWGRNNRCDKQLLKKLQKEIIKADFIIGQNSNHFDLPYIQGRLAYHGLPPIITKQQPFLIDIMKYAKRSFYLNSYSLDYRLKYHGKKGKKKMDWDDMVTNMLHNTTKAHMDKMLEYNDKDTTDTLWLFYKELPYYKLPRQLINLLNQGNVDCCPDCNGTARSKHQAPAYTAAGIQYIRWKCVCGRVYRDFMTEKKRKLLEKK